MTNSENKPVVEILILSLKPGTRDKFHQLYVTEALPLLRKWNFNVVAHGPSLHDANTYYVVRAFKDLEDRQRSEDAYYGSDDWQKGPRTEILAMIESYPAIVVSTEKFKDWARCIDLEE